MAKIFWDLFKTISSLIPEAQQAPSKGGWGGKRHEENYLKGTLKSSCLKSVIKRKMWKADGEKKTLHIMRKMIINTGDFMSEKNARKKIEEKYF